MRQSGRDVLAVAGLRVTRQRLAVLDRLAGSERALTAGAVHRDLRDAGLRVGLTTVYRTLVALAEAGQVHRFALGGEHAYTWCPGSHPHLRCELCGWVRPLADAELDRWLAAVAARESFAVTAHHAEIVGVCAACR